MRNLEIKAPGTPANTDPVTVPVSHTSSMYSVGWKDGLRALLIAAVTPVLFAIQDSIAAGVMTFEWKKLAMIAFGAGLSYILKNFFTSSQVVIKQADLPK